MAMESTLSEKLLVLMTPEFKADLLRESGAQGYASMAEYIRDTMRQKMSADRTERVKWERRQDDLKAWDDDELETRFSHLATMRRDESQEREYRFINDLLNKRAARKEAIAQAA